MPTSLQMLTAWQRPLYKSYRVPYCSLGAFFYATTIVALVLTPLYVAWLSHCTCICDLTVQNFPLLRCRAVAVDADCVRDRTAAFWITEKTWHEQPQVLDNGQFVVVAEGFRTNGAASEPFQVVATSSSAVNALLGSAYRTPTYKVWHSLTAG